MASPILKYFAFEHLPPKLQEVSKPIGELAVAMDEKLPDGAEKSAGLRKLLEAKDCLVRALLPLLLFALALTAASASAQEKFGGYTFDELGCYQPGPNVVRAEDRDDAGAMRRWTAMKNAEKARQRDVNREAAYERRESYQALKQSLREDAVELQPIERLRIAVDELRKAVSELQARLDRLEGNLVKPVPDRRKSDATIWQKSGVAPMVYHEYVTDEQRANLYRNGWSQIKTDRLTPPCGWDAYNAVRRSNKKGDLTEAEYQFIRDNMPLGDGLRNLSARELEAIDPSYRESSVNEQDKRAYGNAFAVVDVVSVGSELPAQRRPLPAQAKAELSAQCVRGPDGVVRCGGSAARGGKVRALVGKLFGK